LGRWGLCVSKLRILFSFQSFFERESAFQADNTNKHLIIPVWTFDLRKSICKTVHSILCNSFV